MFQQIVYAFRSCTLQSSKRLLISRSACPDSKISKRFSMTRDLRIQTTNPCAKTTSSADRIKAVFNQYGKKCFTETQLASIFKYLDDGISSFDVSLLARQCRRTENGELYIDDFIDGLCADNNDSTGKRAVSELRDRLLTLGRTFSVEVAPTDVTGSAQRKSPTLLELQDQATRPLGAGNLVFINMVKANMAHFGDVAAATKALSDASLVPVPHVPASRFANTADFQATLSMLSDSGAQRLLVLGGNDLDDQASVCAYPDGAGGLLAVELESLKTKGVTEIGLGGHPDGHPALGGDEKESLEVLLKKAKPLLLAGLDVSICSQFCFDARKLVRWLKQTHVAMMRLQATCREELRAAGTDGQPGKVRFRVGVAGPTVKKRLERIAKICEVPSFFVSSAFDVFDKDGDGLLSLEELQAGASALGLSKRGSVVERLYAKHAGQDHLLGRDEFSRLIVDDAVMDSRPTTSDPENRQIRAAQGPSTFVEGTRSSSKENNQEAPSIPEEPVKANTGNDSDVIWPEELILAIAAYCARAETAPDEITLHFFPFSGLAKTFELTSVLQDGAWPLLTDEDNIPASPKSPTHPSIKRLR